MNKKKTILMFVLFSLLLLSFVYQTHIWFDGGDNAIDIIVKVGLFQFVLATIGFIASINSLIEIHYSNK